MSGTKVIKEPLFALCDNCKCCLAKTSHCWHCHINSTIAGLCGCGDCPSRADAFYDLEQLRIRGLRNIRSVRNKEG